MSNQMTISKDTVFKGEFHSKGKITLEGRVEGNGHVEGTLLVSRTGSWVGNIVTDIVIVEGAVEGNIAARQKLLLLANARVNGTLFSKCIHMEEGARFTGKLQMKSPALVGEIIDCLDDRSANRSADSEPQKQFKSDYPTQSLPNVEVA